MPEAVRPLSHTARCSYWFQLDPVDKHLVIEWLPSFNSQPSELAENSPLVFLSREREAIFNGSTTPRWRSVQEAFRDIPTSFYFCITYCSAHVFPMCD
jgi:hypothetical protein